MVEGALRHGEIPLPNRYIPQLYECPNLWPLVVHQYVQLLLHAHGVLVHQQEERHTAHVLPHSLEVRGDVRVGTVVEEGIHVDDVLVGRNVAQHLVLILKLHPDLGYSKE